MQSENITTSTGVLFLIVSPSDLDEILRSCSWFVNLSYERRIFQWNVLTYDFSVSFGFGVFVSRLFFITKIVMNVCLYLKEVVVSGCWLLEKNIYITADFWSGGSFRWVPRDNFTPNINEVSTLKFRCCFYFIFSVQFLVLSLET